MLPVFQSSIEELGWVREPAVAADDAVVSERLRPLSRLYATLGDTVAVEVGEVRASQQPQAPLHFPPTADLLLPVHKPHDCCS